LERKRQRSLDVSFRLADDTRRMDADFETMLGAAQGPVG